jgi:hypothetical protein
MTEPLQSLGEQLTALARQAWQAMNGEVDDIIQSGERDAARIEHLLDHMLGFCYDPDMLAAYKRLCRHYFAINPLATADYVHAYREMWDMAGQEPVEGGRVGYGDSAEAGGAGV